MEAKNKYKSLGLAAFMVEPTALSPTPLSGSVPQPAEDMIPPQSTASLSGGTDGSPQAGSSSGRGFGMGKGGPYVVGGVVGGAFSGQLPPVSGAALEDLRQRLSSTHPLHRESLVQKLLEQVTAI